MDRDVVAVEFLEELHCDDAVQHRVPLMPNRWIERILQSKRPADLKQYQEISGSWHTCAVGEAHADFPGAVRYHKHLLSGIETGPVDPTLLELGNEFHDRVSRGQRHVALKVYDKIQSRVRELVAKQPRG